MPNPCLYQDEIRDSTSKIVRLETLAEEHGKKSDRIEEKVDHLIDIVGSLKNNRGFIGGIAAAGWLVGALMCDLAKTFAKPVLASILAVMK